MHRSHIEPVHLTCRLKLDIFSAHFDHGTNLECSFFWIHIVLFIRYMANDSNLGLYIGILGFSMTFMIIFLVLVAVIWQL